MSPDATTNGIRGPSHDVGRIVDIDADYPAMIRAAVAEMTGVGNIDTAVHQSEPTSLALHG